MSRPGDLWRKRGAEHGYPECCIEAFVADCLHGTSRDRVLSLHDQRVLCPGCLEKERAMNSEQAVAPTTNEDVVNPSKRLPAERSTRSLGKGRARQEVAGDRVNEGAARTSSSSSSATPVEVHPEDFCSHPIPDKDPDRFWRPVPEYPEPKGGPDSGEALERFLNYRKQRGA